MAIYMVFEDLIAKLSGSLESSGTLKESFVSLDTSFSLLQYLR